MSSPTADRNLLFGILALQMDFISRDALVAAMSAWVIDKSKSLGQVLREQNALSAEEDSLIDALVRKHLQKHGDDVQQSLAAVRSLPRVRQDLRQVADADVQASLAHVGDTPTHDPDATSAHTGPVMLPPDARFQILRPHARGSLGEVFVARDGELKREVALKEIQARHADHPESRARFVLEAEVTGSLEHPGIVPVYGLGVYLDGRPYYAMRFIKGDSLKDAIECFHNPGEPPGLSRRSGGDKPRRSPGFASFEFRQLLSRFVAVCNAIAYAHSRGVIHRDIKPANVMLGKYGETLVVDWGLAKILGQSDVETTEAALVSSGDSGLTQAGKAMGTPAYMSPEQAGGRLERIGPASDTYSLGATLYCLLTGKPPFTDPDVGVVLAKVQKGDFKPPRQLNPKVPAALEAVCLKAMAHKAEDRYSSPRELADEIEHWLADEPVSAHREPLPARLARGMRKRPALTAGAGALLLTGVIALAVSTLLIGRAQRETTQALRNEEQARKDRVLAQLAALGDAAPGAVPGILAELEANRDDVLPRLRERYSEEGPRGKRMRLALALLGVEPEKVRDELVAWMLQADDPAEVLLVRDALVPHAADLKQGLWNKVATARTSRERFRALAALAAFDPDSPRWDKSAAGAIDEMLSANPLHLGAWVEALRPVRQQLLAPLEAVFRNPKAESKQVAAQVLAAYAADRPEVLAELLLAADSKQYAVLKPVLMRYPEQATARMRRELAATPDYWKDAPLDPAWKEAPAEQIREVEQAGGMVAQRFALCQALPLERVAAVTEGLRAAGYRPVRVRPWGRTMGRIGPMGPIGPIGPQPPPEKGSGDVEVAIVWTRDAVDWTLKTSLTAAQAKTAPAGMIPADVAGYHTKDGVRYLVLWRKPGKGEQAVVYAGVPEAKHKTATDVFKDDGFFPASVHTLAAGDGSVRYSGVWWKGPDKPQGWNLWWGDPEQTHDDRVFSGERLLLDVSLGPASPPALPLAWVAGLAAAPCSLAAHALASRYRDLEAFAAAPRHYASAWRDDTACQALGLHGLSADAHLARCRELAARGYRPVALSLTMLAGEKLPLAASAWHRPVPSAAERDRLAARQATAAATLLLLNQADEVWPLLRHTPDPTVRFYLIERVGSRAVDPSALLRRLEQEKDVSARRALIVALGEFGETDLPATERAPLVKKLLAWYRDDPDAGIHGAIDWILRHAKEGPAHRPLDWGQALELERIDKQLAGKPPLAPPPRFGEGAGGRRVFFRLPLPASGRGLGGGVNGASTPNSKPSP